MFVTQSEFKTRREKVLQYMSSLSATNAQSPPRLVLRSGTEKIYSNDVHYPFRADGDFYYLTGFTEPDSVLVLDPNANHPYTLYVRPRDPAKEIWDGPREGVEGTKKNYGADKVYEIAEFIKHKESVTCNDLNPGENESTKQILGFVHELRSIKSPAEINTMRKANQIAIQAHRLIKETITQGIYEYEIEASLNNVFRSQGASGWAYPPIVASGANSCILHYIKNDRKIQSDDLVLVDAGCEFEYYASDITRVYPANGKFTIEQKEIYDLVVLAQKKAIESIRPGSGFKETHDIACVVLAEGLFELGYIKTKSPESDEFKKYYMHTTGHSLGIDVHDCGVDKKTSKYVPGMVTTVEPALYLAEKAIGVRIEDNVLVTKDGYENLSSALDK